MMQTLGLVFVTAGTFLLIGFALGYAARDSEQREQERTARIIERIKAERANAEWVARTSRRHVAEAKVRGQQ